MTEPPRPKAVPLRIELLEVVPLVWRRVLVGDHWTLASLHQYLQWVMGWTDSHAHEFQVGDGLVAPDWWIQEAGPEGHAGRYSDERRISVAAVVSELGAPGEFEYRYDMGNGWGHRIVIESPPASVGFMSWRIAERIAAIASSWLASFLSRRASSCAN